MCNIAPNIQFICILFCDSIKMHFLEWHKIVLSCHDHQTKTMLSCLMFYIIATKWEEYLRGHLNAADNNSSSSPPPLNSCVVRAAKSSYGFICAHLHS